MTDMREPAEDTSTDAVEAAEAVVAAAPTGVVEAGDRHRSLWGDVWRQFRRHKGALLGLFLLTLIVLGTLLGPFIWPPDPFEIDVPSANQGASWDHPMGTDNLGRDVMARVIFGARISLSVGFVAMLFGLLLGTGIGVLTKFFR